MSFGLGVGDVLAVSRLALALYGRFKDASGQLGAVGADVRGLQVVLQSVITYDIELDENEKKELGLLTQGSRDILQELSTLLESNRVLEATGKDAKTALQRGWKKFRWDEKQLQGLRSRLTLNNSLLTLFCDRLANKHSSQQFRNVRDDISGVGHRIDAMQLSQVSHERQTIAEWLTPLNFSAQYSDFIEHRRQGTGQWLLQSPVFQTWVQDRGQILFCPGIPGAGKTMLTTTILEHLKCTEVGDGIGLAFIYCNYQRQSEQSPLDLLSSLLKQTVLQNDSLSQDIKDLYLKHSETKTRPGIEEVRCALDREIHQFTKMFLVLDALDEFQDDEGLRKKFLSEVHLLHGTGKVNILATSRPNHNIESEFRDALHLEIRAHEDDVKNYLEGETHRLPNFVATDDALRTAVVVCVAEAVDGMFLLAHLHLESLTDKTTRKALKNALKALPNGSNAVSLSKAYDSALDRIDAQRPGFRQLAERVLLWVANAKAPLTCLQLQHALAVEPDEAEFDEDNVTDLEQIASVCAGLVTIDRESNIIRLVHYTTQEYLLNHSRFWTADAPAEIAKACISYLALEDHPGVYRFESMADWKEDLRAYPFFEHAVLFWADYASAHLGDTDQDWALRLIGNDETRGRFMEWDLHIRRLQRSCLPLHDYNGTLHRAAFHGLATLTRSLLDRGSDPNSVDVDGATSLHAAVGGGHEAIVHSLLSRGANINAVASYGSALCIAAERGDLEVMRLLLDHGADVNVQPEWGEHALIYAASSGYADAVQLLAESNGDVNAEMSIRRGFGTALHAAARGGYTDVARALITHRTDIYATNDRGTTALILAAIYGSENVARLILESEAIHSVKGTQKRRGNEPNPANNAMESTFASPDGGTIIARRDNDHCTALHFAVMKCHQAGPRMTTLLLEWGAPVDAQDMAGNTAMHEASRGGTDGVMSALLEYGASSCVVNGDGDTPWEVAVREGLVATRSLRQAEADEIAIQAEIVEVGRSMAKTNDGQMDSAEHAKIGQTPAARDDLTTVLEDLATMHRWRTMFMQGQRAEVPRSKGVVRALNDRAGQLDGPTTRKVQLILEDVPWTDSEIREVTAMCSDKLPVLNHETVAALIEWSRRAREQV
ncbi:MAG: hypothetical protein M1833_004294 [Piccolia ochrophora]|nr:MAG: hypothetical protein M1833_004294 [Piccolia ochrophora]